MADPRNPFPNTSTQYDQLGSMAWDAMNSPDVGQTLALLTLAAAIQDLAFQMRRLADSYHG